ncbi:MAG: iron-containing alcohol dehydrogenase [Eubacterium sp.]|nr:iron-containing alcohol dehydrogenase [Eubacterium sp.]MDD7209106.1 iron-containing alcohol dehydrogenase [Lachnospiraceae bacterium]MDY5498243.1 iron-containing alcohol dehydrogenase [Anaerobutyricum sp.]
MNNFDFCVPTDIRFGKGQIQCLPEELGKYGKRILMVYGGGSIKRTGLYDEIMDLLKDFDIYELPGIEPNPKIASVRKGAAICKEKKIDVILAVGGGSSIDASKHIACAAYYDGDPWDLMLDRKRMTKALPIAVVLTLAATGSEMNPGAVITNDETNEKLEIAGKILYPTISICDPTYLYTLPPRQTAAGVADILSHAMEQYFQPTDDAYLTDRITESLMRTVIHYGPIAMKDPENYEARANIMWAGSLGLNHILTVGKGGAWSCHPIEHELSAYYDITHGEGLAIVTPAWMRSVLCDKTVKRFAMFAKNVWGIEADNEREAAEKSIEALEQFFKSMGLPSTLKEVGIGPDKFEEMAREAVRTSGISTRSYYPLNEKEIVKIYEDCAE